MRCDRICVMFKWWPEGVLSPKLDSECCSVVAVSLEGDVFSFSLHP